MEARKFAIGDQVRVLLDNYANDSPADVYTVSRILPATANIWQYRVKRFGDGQERAVTEQQLAKSVFHPLASRSMPLASRSMAEAQQDLQRVRNAGASVRTRMAARRPDHGRH